MARRETGVGAVCGPDMDARPGALRAVYLVETRTADEAAEIDRLFSDLQTQVQIRQLCRGRLVGFVIQADETDPDLLDEVEQILKANYSFVVTQGSFDEVIYRIVTELCQDTGSSLLPLDHCDVCGKAEPFAAAVVNLSDKEGNPVESRAYCAGCSTELAPSSKIRFAESLLAADRRGIRRAVGTGARSKHLTPAK